MAAGHDAGLRARALGVEPRAGERGARLLAFAWLFAGGAVALQCFVARAFSAFALSASYELGAAVSIGGQLLGGLLFGLPLLASGSRGARALSGVLAALAYAALAVAYHYHATFARLPTLAATGNLHDPGKLMASLEAALPPWIWVAESALPAALAIGLLDPMTRWLGRARSRLIAAASLLALAAVASLLAPRALQGQAYYGAVHPLVHLLAHDDSAPAPRVRESQALALARVVRGRIGVPERAPADPTYPYCAGAPEVTPLPGGASTPARTVLVILLEGISNRDLTGTYQGKPLMPRLAGLAREGLSFDRFYAVGDRSSQAQFSIVAGVPPETHRRVITHSHLVSFQGFPSALRAAGFDTWYLHGSDLSFEQQRSLLQHAGFDRIVEPDPRTLAGSAGWGLPDREMLTGLMHDVEQRRAAADDRPLFALLATLSTHDPYVTPPGWQRVFSGDDRYSKFADTARYLDEELARLYAWYLQSEKPRGTVLAIVSDHAPRVPAPTDPADTSTGEFEYRFDVPFLLFGQAIDALPAADRQRLATRVGSHADLGPTVLALAGVAPPPCELGMSLLAPDWPEQRWAVSIAGDNLEYLFVHAPPLRWMIPLDGRKPRLYDAGADPLFRRDLFAPTDSRWRDVRVFADAYMKLGAYLNLGDHFAPAAGSALPPPPTRRRARAAGEPLRVISHRGNTQAAPEVEQAGDGKPTENSFAAIDRALAAGFTWVEIDVQVTADHVPVVCHDRTVTAPDGAQITLAKTTLAELRARGLRDMPTLPELFARYAQRASFAVELKPQALWQDDMALARVALAAIDRRPAGMQVVVDSFSQAQASTIQRWSDVEVGWDLPQRPISSTFIELARDRQLDWVYARYDLIGARDVSALHAAGVRVMLYTVNDPAVLARFAADPPDGVITDSAALLRELAHAR